MFATDTHPVAYYASQKHSKLSQRTLRLFEDAVESKTAIYVPTPALWEIHKLVKDEVIELPMRFDHWCRDLDSRGSFIIEPLTWHDVAEARQLPFRDPFDCLIAGTALRLGIPLITKDQVIVDSGLVETIW
jgi:PIN domain nuclease of toxin-antitoxin system